MLTPSPNHNIVAAFGRLIGSLGGILSTKRSFLFLKQAMGTNRDSNGILIGNVSGPTKNKTKTKRNNKGKKIQAQLTKKCGERNASLNRVRGGETNLTLAFHETSGTCVQAQT